MGVSTPVGTVASQGKLYFMAAADAGKVLSLTIEGGLGHFWGFIFDWRNPGEKTAAHEISLVEQEERLIV